jgi:hypothetical protein
MASVVVGGVEGMKGTAKGFGGRSGYGDLIFTMSVVFIGTAKSCLTKIILRHSSQMK